MFLICIAEGVQVRLHKSTVNFFNARERILNFMHLIHGVVHNFQKAVCVLDWISVPYAQKDLRFLFEKTRGESRVFWSLVSTIDGSTPGLCGRTAMLSTM